MCLTLLGLEQELQRLGTAALTTGPRRLDNCGRSAIRNTYYQTYSVHPAHISLP